MDNSHNRLRRTIFISAAGKSIMELVKLQSLLRKCCEIQACKFANFVYVFVLRAESQSLSRKFQHANVVEACPHVVQSYANFARLYFPYFPTTFRNRPLQPLIDFALADIKIWSVMDHFPIRQTFKFENNFSTVGKSFLNLVKL